MLLVFDYSCWWLVFIVDIVLHEWRCHRILERFMGHSFDMGTNRFKLTEVIYSVIRWRLLPRLQPQMSGVSISSGGCLGGVLPVQLGIFILLAFSNMEHEEVDTGSKSTIAHLDMDVGVVEHGVSHMGSDIHDVEEAVVQIELERNLRDHA